MEIYKGRTPEKDYNKLIEMLDDTFFRDDNEIPKRDFMSLLPKLYKEQYNPCHNNWAVKEGDSLKAAVGLYYLDFSVCGEKLVCGGIGNVAVSRDARSRGYMKDCMHMALDDMKAQGADFGFLGGQRQRYQYFSFDCAGICYDYNVNRTNLRHCYGADAKSKFTAKKLEETDTELMLAVDKLFTAQPAYVERDPDTLFDIFRSWRCTPYAVTDGNEVKAFFNVLRDGNGISTFKIADGECLRDTLLAIFETLGESVSGIGISVAQYDFVERDALDKICSGVDMSCAEHITVLNYEHMIKAYLNLRASAEKLSDGSLNVLIHGENGDEQLLIKVNDGKVSVTKTDGAPEVELQHLDAIRYFFAFNSVERDKGAAAVKTWFPLPVFVFGCDGV